MRQTIYFLGVAFLMCFATIAVAQPANDDCANASPISLPSSGQACVTGTTVGATGTTYTTPICGQTAWNNDVWYTFVSTGTYTYVTLSPTGSPAAQQLGIAVFIAGPCGGSLVGAGGAYCSVSTTNGGSDTVFAAGGPVGTTYLIEVNSFGTAGRFDLCVNSITPPDSPGTKCSKATKLCTEAAFTLSNVPPGGSNFTPDCFGATPQSGVWYQFTVGVTGSLSFLVSPTTQPSSPGAGDGVELDWAMYDITSGCPTTANQASSEVACNYNYEGENSDPIGMSTTTYGPCPTSAVTFSGTDEICQSITVTAGQTYAIFINNYTNTIPTGWDFNFNGSTFVMAPVDTFTLTPDTICGTTGTITLTNQSAAAIWQQWNFGDGTNSLAVTPPAHTYSTPGTYFVTLKDSSQTGCVAVTSKSVLITPYPTVTIARDTVCADASGTLTAVPSVAGGTYLWSTGATTASITKSPASTTTYTVTYTSATGCTATASGTITVIPLPTPGVNSLSVCAGSPATLTATGGTTYAWSQGGTGASITVTPAATTTYTVTATTSGCSATASGTVTVKPLPTPAVSSTTVCAGSPATLNATGGSTYVWSQGGTNSSITVTPAATTTYTVTATTSGCTATASGTVTVNPAPTPAVTNTTVCAGNPATLTATGGSTYVWSQGGTNSSITVTPAATTTYTVTATTSGCTATASGTVTVTPAPIPAVSSTTVCAGSPATLTASGGTTYVWSQGGTNSSITVTPAATTTYTVTATTAGCTATASGTVTVNPAPTPAVSSTTVCAGNPATLTASGGTTYVWSQGGTNASITVTPAATTTYIVTATTSGCTATASGTVTVNPLPTPSVSSTTICAGSPATLNVTGGTTYVWSQGGTNSSITVTPAATTTYTVTATTSGCTATASGTVTVNPLPTPAVTSTTVCAGDPATLNATGGTTYVWSQGGTNSSITVTPAATTTYTVTATTSGCTATASGTVTVNPLPTPAVTSTTICAGDPATLTATGGTTYAWSQGGTNSSITVTPATTTTYTVTATTSGCTATASGTVTVNPLPTPGVTSATVCAGDPATLNATGGTTYVWSQGGTNSSITVTPAATTTYTVTATTSGCTATASGTVTVNPLPTPAVTSATVCAGDPATLNATDGTTYVWSQGGINSSITVTPAATTTYTVTATTSGCTATASGTVTVNPLPAPTVNNTAMCIGTSATLIATGGTTYVWSQGGTNSSITVTPAATTTYTVTATTSGCTATASGTVTVNPLPAPSVNNQSVCSGNPAVLTATPGGLSYLWSTNATTQSITTLTPGTYDVTVTDGNGCSATTSGNVTGGAPPAPSVTSTTVCTGDPATLTASGGTSYVWSTTAMTTSITTTLAGTYTVTVTNAAGCTATASGTVTLNPLPTPSVTSATVCAGNTATISVSGGVSYLWSTNETGPSISNTNPGVYTVTATDGNGCSATASGTITVNPLPTPSVNNATVCNGDIAILTDTGGIAFLWSTTAITQSISTSTAGTYEVTVTDANGCTATASGTVTVNQLPSPSVNSATVCTGDTAILNATGGVSYIWNTGATTASIDTTAPGIYTVTATDVNGCSATASGSVQLNALPTPTVNNASSCAGGAATLTATGGASYIWSTSDITSSITESTPGTYTVTATDGNGCSATASGTVTINPLPTPTVNNATICAGGIATLTASGVGTYEWSTTETTQSISATSAGTYLVTVTDGNGCSATASGTVTVNPLPVVTVTTNPAICTASNGMAIANVTSGTPAYAYNWSAPGGTDDTLSNLAPNTYTVSVTDINGCSASASGTVSQQTSTITLTESQHDLKCFNDGTGDIYITPADNAGGVSSYTFGYNWGAAGSTQNLTGLQAGTYTVTVTDQFGCTGTGSWTLTQPAQLTGTTSEVNPTCFGLSNGSATVTPAGGSGAYHYAWNTTPAQDTATATNLASGTYSVSVTDDSLCLATFTVTLTDPAQITFGSSTVTDPSCFGSSNGAAQVAPQNGIGSYTYMWSTSPVQTTNPATNLAGGSYTVTATDVNGCTASTSVTLVSPSQVAVTASGTNLSCYQSANGTATAVASGGTPPYSYSWNNEDSTATINNLPASTYYVTATDANGCPAVDSTTLSQPGIVGQSLLSVRTNCTYSSDGQVIDTAAGGTPPFTYTLEAYPANTVVQSGNTSGTFTNVAAGIYTVVATDNNGCPVSDTITVPLAPFNYYTDTAVSTSCYGPQYSDGIIHMQGYSIPNGPFSYGIDGGTPTSSPDFFNLSAGPHKVTAQDAYGCDTTFTIIVPEPQPATVQILPGDSTITAGTTLQLNTAFGPYSSDSIRSYSWSPGTGMSCIDCPSPQVSPYTNVTTYTVIITYNQGCTASASVQITVNGEPPVYVPNAFTPNGDGTNDVWYVYGTGIKDVKAMIFDRWGEKVFESDNQSQGWDGTFRGQMQSPGVYVYMVTIVYLDGTTETKQGSLSMIR